MNEDDDIIWTLFTEATQPEKEWYETNYPDSMHGDDESEEAAHYDKQSRRDFYALVVVPGAHGMNKLYKRQFIGSYKDINAAIAGAKLTVEEAKNMNFDTFPDEHTQAAAGISVDAGDDIGNNVGDLIVVIGNLEASEGFMHAVERAQLHQSLSRQFDSWLSQFELL